VLDLHQTPLQLVIQKSLELLSLRKETSSEKVFSWKTPLIRMVKVEELAFT
jgi:hypothetical protein